jgi:uncharacterized protein YlxW (UPF0749 family)
MSTTDPEPGPVPTVEPPAGPRDPDGAPGEPDGGPGPARDPQRAWRRLLRAGSPRATRANILAMVLAGALGFAIIAQVRQTSIQGLENLREDELVRIFAGVDQDGDRLADDIRGLETSLELLQSRSTNEAEAQRAAQERLDALGILAGTSPATGQGIVLTITGVDGTAGAPIILDTVQELRAAGAEAIQIGDQRVVANTWIAERDGELVVSGSTVAPPYVIRVIGDADTEIRDEVEIDALLSLTPPQYARPVPTSTP